MALRGEAHPKAKLTEAEVLKIRELYDKGFSPRILARNFSVSLWNIKEIIRRKTWKHL